jgi:hypothetical protein
LMKLAQSWSSQSPITSATSWRLSLQYMSLLGVHFIAKPHSSSITINRTGIQGLLWLPNLAPNFHHRINLLLCIIFPPPKPNLY